MRRWWREQPLTLRAAYITVIGGLLAAFVQPVVSDMISDRPTATPTALPTPSPSPKKAVEPTASPLPAGVIDQTPEPTLGTWVVASPAATAVPSL